MEQVSCESEDFEDVKTRRSSSIERRFRNEVDLVEGLGEMGLTRGWWSLSRLSTYWLVSEIDGIGSNDGKDFEKDVIEGGAEAGGEGSETSVEERSLSGVWNSWMRVRELRRTILGVLGEE